MSEDTITFLVLCGVVAFAVCVKIAWDKRHGG